MHISKFSFPHQPASQKPISFGEIRAIGGNTNFERTTSSVVLKATENEFEELTDRLDLDKTQLQIDLEPPYLNEEQPRVFIKMPLSGSLSKSDQIPLSGKVITFINQISNLSPKTFQKYIDAIQVNTAK